MNPTPRQKKLGMLVSGLLLIAIGVGLSANETADSIARKPTDFSGTEWNPPKKNEEKSATSKLYPAMFFVGCLLVIAAVVYEKLEQKSAKPRSS